MNDYEGIRRTLAQYCQLLDDGHFDQFAQLFTADTTFLPLGGKVVKGRDQVRKWTDEIFPSGQVNLRHLTMNAIIDINGDSATVRADILMMMPSPQGPLCSLIAQYDDELVRDDGRWRFKKRQVIAQTQDWIAPVLGLPATGPLKS